MMMKKFTKISTLFILLSVLCGSFLIQIQAKESTKANGEGELLDKIMERGELIVGTSPDFPPNEFIDTTKTGQDLIHDIHFLNFTCDFILAYFLLSVYFRLYFQWYHPNIIFFKYIKK